MIIMRLWLVAGSLAILLQTIGAQRSWWPDRAGARLRHRQRLRRHRSQHDRPQRRRLRRPQHDDDSYEGDQLVISSSELSRRVNKFQRSQRPRSYDHHPRSDYYPTRYKNESEASTLLESTPEYRIETRNGDTIIEFARSGETQG